MVRGFGSGVNVHGKVGALLPNPKETICRNYQGIFLTGIKRRTNLIGKKMISRHDNSTQT